MGEMLDYAESYRLLDKFKINHVDGKYVGSAKDAVSFARGKAIVMKVISQKAVHKTRSGLIALNLRADKEIGDAFASLAKRGGALGDYKIFVQRMSPPGPEIIVGGNVDAQFGKLVLLGLGGIYVETFRDFALRVCPITEFDALSMIEQLRSRDVIAPDEKARAELARIIIRASKLFYDPKFSELDINPLIFHEGKYEAVDVRLIKGD